MSRAQDPRRSGRFRLAGQVIGGFLLGFTLLPAAFELLALVGDIAPFRYQGY